MHIRPVLFRTILLLGAVVLVDCGQLLGEVETDHTGKATPWTHLKMNDDAENFHFAIVADRTGGARPGVFRGAIDMLNLLQPAFVMSVGDLVEGYTEDKDKLTRQYDEFDGIVGKLTMPFFRTVGNHDINNDVMVKMYHARYGKSYYHFIYKNVLFLVVSTEDGGRGKVSDQQVAYLTDVLKKNQSVRWTMVFMHDPLYRIDLHEAWGKIQTILKDRPHTVFAGHNHLYLKEMKHGHKHFRLGTTGGGSRLRGADIGELDQIAWITMTNKGPIMANIALEGIYDENLVTLEALEKALAKRQPIQSDVIYIIEGETFDNTTVPLRIVNHSDSPMKIEAILELASASSVKPERFNVVVPAKSTKTIDVKVATAQPVKPAGVTLVRVPWTASYKRNGLVEKQKGVFNIGVADKQDCPRAESEIVIDGKLDEWKSLPIDVSKTAFVTKHRSKFTLAKNGKYRFAVAYDDKYLYVAIKATDDKLFLDPKKRPWRQDSVEVRLDARTAKTRNLADNPQEWGSILPVILAPAASEKDKMVIYSRDRFPKGTQCVSVVTPAGHNTEIAIPISYLNQRQGGKWKDFRLNVGVNDFDAATEGAYRQWRPDWRKGKSFVGTGTFVRK